MPSCRCRLFYACIFLTSLSPLSAGSAAANEHRPSATLMGPIGLNTVPSARMDKAGTVRIGVGTIDPYLHSFAGFQLTDRFYVGVRQSAEKSSLTSTPDRLYPGVDLKIKLNNEGRYDPEVAVGFLSAFGHKKTASEYIALSKRYNNFDFTFGMGWGRLAGDGHLSNPLKRMASHFGNDRDFNNEVANSAHDWFTGSDVSFFGGLEYQTPLEGVSLKADWGANPYSIEENTIPGFNAPAPWSIGVNYSPVPWVDGMIGIAGTDTVMARLSLQSNAMDWLTRPYKDTTGASLLPRDETNADAGKMMEAAEQGAIYLSDTHIDGDSAIASLHLNSHRPLAYQIGRAARHVANNAGKNVETITIIPMRGKIKGRPISFLRRDLEQALAQHQGSPEEVWRNTHFDAAIKEGDGRGFFQSFDFNYNVALKNDVSLSEDDAEYLYRSAAVLRGRAELPEGLFAGGDFKINISDNLDKLDDRNPNLDVTRSDVDAYTKRRFYLERAYGGMRKTILDDVFLSYSGGLLDEMYAGYGGEVLYRPFGKTFALGFEGWQVFKRDPSDMWGLTANSEPRVTGHFNLFYEVPETDMTAYAKVGQYLGGDTGVTLGLDRQFNGGATLGGIITATKESDYDTLGGATHFYSGIQLKVPLGNVPYVPEGSEVITTFHPQGRDAGQFLDNPEPLYKVTEPVSYRAASRSWNRLLD